MATALAPADLMDHSLATRPAAARPAAEKTAHIAAAALGFWLVYELLGVVNDVANGQVMTAAHLPAEGLMIAGGVIVCLMLQRMGLRLLRYGVAVRIGAPIFATVFVSILFSIYVRLAFGWLWPERFAARPATTATILAESTFWVVFFGLWLALTLLWSLGRRARERERQLSEALAAAQRAQILALHYQVNPHFLFNTLNSISALVLDNSSSRAERMLLQLSHFFRASLALDPSTDVRLDEEIEHQQLYLNIEKERFDERLAVSVEIDPDTASTLVPSLILQPLVENAIKHGSRAPGRTLSIGIACRRVGDMAELVVENSTDGRSSASGERVGLKNVAQRLSLRFGASARMRVIEERGLFTVILTIPLRSAS